LPIARRENRLRRASKSSQIVKCAPDFFLQIAQDTLTTGRLWCQGEGGRIEDADTLDAARWLWFEFGVAADLSGAAAVPALLSGRVRPKRGERVADWCVAQARKA
jgi:hypothetical protein